MDYVIEMLTQGVRYLHHDPYLAGLTTRTIQLAVYATLIAAVLGFPLACVLGLGRSRVSKWSLIVANAGLGLPPVAIGVYGLLIFAARPTPWGGRWDTMNGMVVAQAVLSLPVIVALGAIAIRRLPDGLLDQAQAFGASGWRLGLFALREARIGIVAAVVLAMGSAFAEVGAVTIIGGNSVTSSATLASQVLNDIGGGRPAAAVEHLIVLFGLMLALGLIFTLVQQWDARFARRRRPGLVRWRARLRAVVGLVAVAALLAACGETTPPFSEHRNDYTIFVSGGLPTTDIARAAQARAQEVSMLPTMTGAGRTSLGPGVQNNSALRPFDARTNTTPPVKALLVVPRFTGEDAAPQLAAAVQRGVKIVSYPARIPGAAAAIVIDAPRAGAMLATRAAAWARANLGGRGEVLLALPSPDARDHDPFAADGARVEQAMRATLNREAPRVTVRVTHKGGGASPAGYAPVDQALRAHPGIRMVLLGDDVAAPGAAQSLRRRHPGARKDLYVGALGSPTVASRATLTELRRDDVLRDVVAVSVSALGRAMVDLPRAVLSETSPGDSTLPLVTLTPGSAALAEYAKDYAPHPGTLQPNTVLNGRAPL